MSSGSIVGLKPRPAFLPLFALCPGVEERDGLIFVLELLGIGGPDGEPTLNCHSLSSICPHT